MSGARENFLQGLIAERNRLRGPRNKAVAITSGLTLLGSLLVGLAPEINALAHHETTLAAEGAIAMGLFAAFVGALTAAGHPNAAAIREKNRSIRKTKAANT